MSLLRRFSDAVFGVPREGSELVREITISATPYYIKLECRKSSEGLFGILFISGQDGGDFYVLEPKQFLNLVRGLENIKKE
jgi:hypothetical protein